MTPAKRAFDLVLALTLAALLALPFAALLVWLWLREGPPLFHVAERMHAPGRSFELWKQRTMTPAPCDSGVSGGDKALRIARSGTLLRRTRLDGVPQLWNVILGDMTFVGPRPPLRQHVERFPGLYARVLRSRPGITGLACHRHEERLLARCRTPEETDSLYARALVPRKARLDLIYQRRRSLCLDVVLLWRTLARILARV